MSHRGVFTFDFSKRVWLLLVLATLVPSTAWSYEETKVTDGGTIEGKVVFRGTVPPGSGAG